ncbi:MAG: DRTGG domain-containing protein [Bacillota bacterium]|nr:DRTGG domain-containing protein [Bacillota bacterium]
MRVRDLLDVLECRVEAGAAGLDNEVKGGYASDLLSDVMAHAGEGDVWVTVQAHQNVVAVATLVSLACVVVAGGVECEPEAARRAEEEGIPLLRSRLPAFEVVGRLYVAGIRARPGAD